MIEGVNLKPQLVYRNKHVQGFKGVYARRGLYEPYEYFAVWLTDTNIGKLGVANVSMPGALTPIKEFFDVIDIDLCFDGQWVRHDNSFLFVTSGEPIVAAVKSDGRLCLDNIESTSIYIDGNYKSVAIIRGWKSLINDDDIGILVAACYNNIIDIYRYKDNSTLKVHTIECDEQIVSLNYSLLADYRVALYVYTETNTIMYNTERLYIGGATSPDYASICDFTTGTSTTSSFVISNTRCSIDFNSCEIYDIEMLSCTVDTYNTSGPTFIKASNPNDTIIVVEINALYYFDDYDLSSIEVVNQYSQQIQVTDVSKEGTRLILSCKKFNNFAGSFTISYSGKWLKLSDSTLMDSFKTTFVPTGLVPDDVEPPEVYFIDVWKGVSNV